MFRLHEFHSTVQFAQISSIHIEKHAMDIKRFLQQALKTVRFAIFKF